MTDCLFCNIANQTLAVPLVYEDELVVAFHDIKPQAPLHLLIIPKRHISTLNDIADSDTSTVGHLIQVAQRLAKEHSVAEDGYRVVMNCNEHGGQTVFHIHLHLLAGRRLEWPPG